MDKNCKSKAGGQLKIAFMWQQQKNTNKLQPPGYLLLFFIFFFMGNRIVNSTFELARECMVLEQGSATFNTERAI